MYFKNSKYDPFITKDFFIFEISAIPLTSRLKFREKLLKRKGAEDQKNLSLLELYCTITDDQQSTLDDIHDLEIAAKIGVSKRMLDCHKSRLLKNLREYYFQYTPPAFFKTDEERLLVIDKLFKLGMVREARVILLEAEHELDHDKQYSRKSGQTDEITAKRTLYEFEIYEKLADYYLYAKDLRRFNLYFKKLKKITENYEVENDKSNEVISKMRSKLFYKSAQKKTLNRFRLRHISNAIEDLKQSFKYSAKVKEKELQLKILFKLGQLYNIAKERDLSLRAFEQGLDLSAKYGNSGFGMVFDTYILLRKFTLDNRLAKKALKTIEGYYDSLQNKCSNIEYLMDVEFIFLRFLIYLNNEMADDVSADYIRKQVLYSRKADAISSWYLELSDRLSSSVFRWSAGPEIIVNTDKLEEFNRLNIRSLAKFRNLYSPNVLAIVYINSLEQEFWKFDKGDFQLSDIYITKLERIVKHHNINISHTWIESAKLGLRIFEAMGTLGRNQVFNKYRSQIVIFIEKMKSETQSFNISADYAKLLFISQKLNIPQMTEIIEDFSDWVKKNHPDVMQGIAAQYRNTHSK
jgi:hypothetical protein